MTISVTNEGNIWIIRSEFADKDIVKGAGARWNPDRKTWWTDKSEVAAKLAQGDAAAIAAINAEREAAHARAQASIIASRASTADIAVPAPQGLSYLGYQLAGVAYAQARQDTLIADEMGLGKTIQALGVVNIDKSISNVLVICPASLKLNWSREAKKWLTRPLRVSIANGAFPAAGGFVIINYEQVSKYRAQIDAIAWGLLIVDEAHYVKNSKADRTAHVLGRWNQDPKKAINPIRARRRLFLTGTPILNRPIELWTLVHALDRKGLGANWKSFAQRYCAGYQGRYGWTTDGASHLDELQAKLRSSIMIRRMKADVLTELPPKRRSVIAFEPLSEAEKAAIAHEAKTVVDTEERLIALRARVDEARMWADPGAYKRAVAELNQAQFAAFTETSAVRHEVALAKVPQVVAHLKNCLDSEDKIVVMAHHHDVIDEIAAALAEFGVVTFDGRQTLKARDESVARFQNDQSVRVFVGGIMAAGVGITLTASAHVVFAELDWVPGNLAQAEDRCHRIGQVDSVLVQHLVLDGSLDARMAQLLVEKMDVITAAVDDKGADGALPAAPAPLAVPPVVVPVATATQKPVQGPAGNGEQDMPAEQIEAIHEALKMLAGMCDGARMLDGAGFNRLDTSFGHDLAARSLLTQRQAIAGRKLVLKYQRQVPTSLLATIRGSAH
jgi:SWI/SNF-related matrix-associated actin-dependent regulator 1 of chromatin subfamily A